MPRQPIADAGFVAYEQGFEAVEPRVGVLDHDAAAVQLGVEGGVVVGLPVRGAAVAGDIRFDVAPGAFLAKLVGIEGFVRVQEQPGDGNVSRFERGADFAKQGAEQVAVVVVARLRAGNGQRLAPSIGQEKGRGGAGFLAGLIADGLPAVLGGRVAADKLDAGAVQMGPVFAQQMKPHPLPRAVLAPGVEAGVHALPGQGRARKKRLDR